MRSARFSLVASMLVLWTATEIQAGAWTLRKGKLYTKFSAFGSTTRHTFNSLSKRVPFRFGGKSRLYGTHWEISYGLTRDITAYLSVPYLWYRLRDQNRQVNGNTFGDIRTSLKLNVLDRPVVSSLEVLVKFPTANTFDPTQVRVGEGQYDFDMVASFGRAWNTWPAYLNFDIGYRIRTKNRETNMKPGNEVFYRFETGYVLTEKLSVSTSVDGFTGGKLRAFDFPLQHSERRILSIIPRFTYNVTAQWGVEVDYSMPVSGQNYFAGRLLVLGIFFNTSRKDNTISKVTIPSVRGITCCTN